MANAIQEIVVFIASPGDVLDEREAVRRAAESVSDSLGGLTGLRVRAVGWELVAPEYGRPQELINPRVRECDVFVGILNRRWGSSTGTYSSGFTEEFDIARTRRIADQRPNIGLFFRKVPPEYLDDPGPELSKVLAFKHELRAEKSILYQDFEDAADLELKVHRFLEKIVLSTFQSQQQLSGSQTPLSITELEAEVDGPDHTDGARRQLAASFASFAAMAKGSEPQPDLDADRILMASMAFSPDALEMPAHLANRLYRRRDELVLSWGEANLWRRTLLANIGLSPNVRERVIPGWGVLITDDPDDGSIDIGDSIAESTTDENPNVVRGALHTLRELEVKPLRLWPDRETVGSDSEEVARWRSILSNSSMHDIAFEYLAILAEESDRPLLEALAASELSSDAQDTLSAVLAVFGGDCNPLATRLPKPYGKPAEWIASKVRRCIREFNPESLKVLIRAKGVPTDIRVAALRGLGNEQSIISASDLTEFFSDDSMDQQDEILLLASDMPHLVGPLLDASEKATFSFGRRYLEARLIAQTSDVAQLRSRFNDSVLPWQTWEALTWTSDPLVASEAREIIDTEGEVVADRFRREYGEDRSKSLVRFLVDEAERAAVSLLCRIAIAAGNPVGTGEDHKRIVKALSASSLRDRSVLAYLALNPDNIGQLLDPILADTSDWETKILVPDLLLHLGVKAAEVLRTHQQSDIQSHALKFLADAGHVSNDELRGILYSEDLEVRATACEVLLERLSREELIDLLQAYPAAKGSHWYNVIAMLDDKLYGPRSDLVRAQVGAAARSEARTRGPKPSGARLLTD